jgi:pSer/pThr/pTyr-binding forkhead associated (FHA) protein
MPSPRFPATATLLESRQCPLDKFDALYTKITQERRIADGYFLQVHPRDTRLLFVVNGSPFGTGCISEQECSFLEIGEFFAGYVRHPDSPLSFFAADKRLLLGLLVLFRHTPALKFKADLVDMQEILEALAERKVDLILGLRSEDEWAVSICTKGRPALNFFPPGAGDVVNEVTPEDQLVAYARTRPSRIAVDVYEETRVKPAGDAALVTPETRGHLTEVFLRGTAMMQEEIEPELELEEVAPEASATGKASSPSSTSEAPEPTPIALETPLSVVEAMAEAARPSDTAAVGTPTFTGPIPEVSLFLGDKQLGTFSLASGELTIGRTSGNSIIIDNVGVSRRHAVIRVKMEKVFLEDLGSANGTLVRGQKIASHELVDGDEITVVKHRLVYRVPKEGQVPLKPEPIEDIGQQTMYIDTTTVGQAVGVRPGSRTEAATPTLRPRLILPDLKKLALETDEVILGSGPTCQIQLSGMFVGKIHAKIVRTKEGQFKIQHLGGLAGTRVNGEKIAEHVLKHGDEIEIGKQKLLFRLER